MNYEDIDHLLPRYCEGLATEEECRQVESWMEESEDNRKIVDQINTLYIAVDTVNVMRKVDTEKALKKVSSRMIVRKTTWWEWMQRVAAILFIPLSVAFLVQYMHNGKSAVCQMMEIKTNPGMTTSVVLPDSTVVYLNSESSLRYPSVFEGDIRNVELKGEAYFAVTKQVTKPFIVCLDQAEITVLGTEFNVRNYENEAIATTLVKGSVSVTDNSNISECRLRPGQQAVLEKGGITVREVEPIHFVAWKDGFFVYQDKKLDDILNELARWYDFTFSYRNNELKDLVLTAKLKKFDRVDRIFRILTETGKLGFTTQGKEVIVYEK